MEDTDGECIEHRRVESYNAIVMELGEVRTWTDSNAAATAIESKLRAWIFKTHRVEICVGAAYGQLGKSGHQECARQIH